MSFRLRFKLVGLWLMSWIQIQIECPFNIVRGPHCKLKCGQHKRILYLWRRLDRVWSHKKMLQGDHEQELLDQCLVSLQFLGVRPLLHPSQHSWPENQWLPDNPLSILICLGWRLQELWWTMSLDWRKSHELHQLGDGPAQQLLRRASGLYRVLSIFTGNMEWFERE